MTVEGTPAPDNMLWAVAVSADGPRAIAELEGIDEIVVSGQTKIASGTKILVKSVTPADNGGSGYIVLKAKKNTVVTKVVINKAVD